MSLSASNSSPFFSRRSIGLNPVLKSPIQCTAGNKPNKSINKSTGREVGYTSSCPKIGLNFRTFPRITTELQVSQQYKSNGLTHPNPDCIKEFFTSIEKNKIIEVKDKLKCYKIVNQKNSMNETGLMVAADFGFFDIVRLLVDCGADVNAENSDGETALVNAVYSNNSLKVIRYLLTRNALPNLENRTGQNCLHHIAGNASNRIQLMDLLLQFKADLIFEPTVRQPYIRNETFTTETPLQMMMTSRQFSAVKHIIKTQPKPFTFSNSICLGLLSESFKDEFLSDDYLQFLLDTVINPKTDQVLTLLCKYSASGSVSLVKTLVNNGAEPQKVNKDGNNALMCAAVSGQYECVKFLLDYVDVDCINDEGFNGLGLAMNAYCLEKHEHTLKYKQCICTLLQYGAATQRFWDKDCSMTYADKLNSLFEDDEVIQSLLISPKSTVEIEPTADWFPSSFTLQAQALKVIKREKMLNAVPSPIKDKTKWTQDYI